MQEEYQKSRGQRRLIPPVVRYLVLQRGAQEGPFTLAQLQSHWRRGSIAEDALVTQDGLPDWQPIDQLRSQLDENPKTKKARAGAPSHRRRRSSRKKPATIGVILLIAVGILVVVAGVAVVIYFGGKTF